MNKQLLLQIFDALDFEGFHLEATQMKAKVGHPEFTEQRAKNVLDRLFGLKPVVAPQPQPEMMPESPAQKMADPS